MRFNTVTGLEDVQYNFDIMEQQEPSRGHRAAALTVAAGTWTQVPIDTTDFGAMSTGGFVVSQSGVYLCNAAVNAAGSCGIGKDSGVAPQIIGPDGGAVSGCTGLIKADAKDVLVIWVNTAGVTVAAGDTAHNYLEVVPL